MDPENPLYEEWKEQVKYDEQFPKVIPLPNDLLFIILSYACQEESDFLKFLKLTRIPYDDAIRLGGSCILGKQVTYTEGLYFFQLLWDEPNPQTRIAYAGKKLPLAKNFFEGYSHTFPPQPHHVRRLRQAVIFDGRKDFFPEADEPECFEFRERTKDYYLNVTIGESWYGGYHNFLYTKPRKILFDIPLSHKDEAKKLGCEWCHKSRKWYCWSDHRHLNQIIRELHLVIPHEEIERLRKEQLRKIISRIPRRFIYSRTRGCFDDFCACKKDDCGDKLCKCTYNPGHPAWYFINSIPCEGVF